MRRDAGDQNQGRMRRREIFVVDDDRDAARRALRRGDPSLVNRHECHRDARPDRVHITRRERRRADADTHHHIDWSDSETLAQPEGQRMIVRVAGCFFHLERLHMQRDVVGMRRAERLAQAVDQIGLRRHPRLLIGQQHEHVPFRNAFGEGRCRRAGENRDRQNWQERKLYAVPSGACCPCARHCPASSAPAHRKHERTHHRARTLSASTSEAEAGRHYRPADQLRSTSVLATAE